MPGRFVRTKNRTINDIYRTRLSPRIAAELNTVGNQIKLHAIRTHEFRNRTGALEESINFTPVEKKDDGYTMTIFAGGWARVKYANDATLRKQMQRRRRNRRYQRGQGFSVRVGQGIYVIYAKFVEDKGFSVLKKSIDAFQGKVARIIGRRLRLVRIP